MARPKTRQEIAELKSRGYSIDTLDLLSDAEDFLGSLTCAGLDSALEAVDPATWCAGLAIEAMSDRDDVEMRLLAFKLELDVVLQKPEVLIEAARYYHKRISEIAPKIRC